MLARIGSETSFEKEEARKTSLLWCIYTKTPPNFFANIKSLSPSPLSFQSVPHYRSTHLSFCAQLSWWSVLLFSSVSKSWRLLPEKGAEYKMKSFFFSRDIDHWQKREGGELWEKLLQGLIATSDWLLPPPFRNEKQEEKGKQKTMAVTKEVF